MASNYGLNFGFRRSDEDMAVREGRLRTPVGATFKQGSLVAFDPANPGYLKPATAGQVGDGSTVGLLIQEEAMIFSIYQTQIIDSYALGTTKPNTLSAIWSGSGVKVWLKNTAASVRADGRSAAAVQMVDLTGVSLLDYLTWDGTKYTKGTGPSDSMLRVTALSGTDYCEAVLVR